jgi:hypothetical protein
MAFETFWWGGCRIWGESGGGWGQDRRSQLHKGLKFWVRSPLLLKSLQALLVEVLPPGFFQKRDRVKYFYTYRHQNGAAISVWSDPLWGLWYLDTQ